MRRTELLLQRVDAWLFAAEDARRLAAMRIGLCLVFAWRLATLDYGLVSRQPALYQPHSYMRLFAEPPSTDVVTLVQAVGVVAAGAAAVGLVFRISLPVALVCALFLDGLRNSGGRIVVGDALLILCLLVVAASGRAAVMAWSAQPYRSSPRASCSGWPVRTAMIAVALAYFFAGVQKWRYSGLSWVTSDNLRWILYASSDAHAHANGLAIFVADRPLLAHALAAAALLLETSFPLVLLVPRLRWLFLPGVVAMHVGILFAMGLDYTPQLLTVVIVFVNWPRVVEAMPIPAVREAPG
jgi:hypothetical protein